MKPPRMPTSRRVSDASHHIACGLSCACAALLRACADTNPSAPVEKPATSSLAKRVSRHSVHPIHHGCSCSTLRHLPCCGIQLVQQVSSSRRRGFVFPSFSSRSSRCDQSILSKRLREATFRRIAPASAIASLATLTMRHAAAKKSWRNTAPTSLITRTQMMRLHAANSATSAV